MALDFSGSMGAADGAGSARRGAAMRSRSARGLTNHLSGAAAEERVMLDYLAGGAVCLEQRWRGAAGEIDLIFRHEGVVVFVEVKCSATLDRAIESLRPTQIARIYAAGSEYLANVPEGQLAEVRFDLAAVDGTGRVEIVENAFGHF